jgi:hypothetical protein
MKPVARPRTGRARSFLPKIQAVLNSGKAKSGLFFTDQNFGSWGFAVMNRQFWRQFDLLSKSCRSPVEQLLA